MLAADKNRDDLKNLNVLEGLCPLLASAHDTIRNTATCLTATLVCMYACMHICMFVFLYMRINVQDACIHTYILSQLKNYEVRRAVRARNLPFIDNLVHLLNLSESAITRENTWYGHKK